MLEKCPIIALDFSDLASVITFLEHFPKEELLFVKIGMELYYSEGPSIIRYFKSLGHRIFLDLKLHDIPNTVRSSMSVLAKLGIDMTNVHAAGGVEMMKAAREGLGEGPILLAVTQLTSTSQEQMQVDQHINLSVVDSVCHYAQKAQEAGLDGVVTSAQEVKQIKKQTNEHFICLTPGIRPPQTNQLDDQKRTMTPEQARIVGADYIVVGRPITKAENPYQAYLDIKEEWNRIK